ncbi:MAG: IS110 family transposase [Synergistales bacterium]|nr:IS110 family transposase [Synergistales bacterium]
MGLKTPPGLARWSRAGIKALAELEISPDLRFVLNSFLSELDSLIRERQKTEDRIKEKAAEERFAKNRAILESHPGVGLLTTMGFLTEVYQPDRFKEETQVALYLGLAPGVKQSGDRRIAKPLLKAGQGPLRCLLIQAAWVWVGSDHRAAKVYGRLLRNTGCKQKAIVGVARRLAINLWWMLLRSEEDEN